MRGTRTAAILFGIGLLFGCAATVNAQDWSLRAQLLERHTNEAGFTLDDCLKLNIGELITHPLASSALSHVDTEVHKAPHRGVQIELLTPGDFGGTIHFRW